MFFSHVPNHKLHWARNSMQLERINQLVGLDLLISRQADTRCFLEHWPALHKLIVYHQIMCPKQELLQCICDPIHLPRSLCRAWTFP